VFAASCCSQVLWIRNQLEDYSLRHTYIPILCDNTSSINLSKYHIQHSRSKDIEIKHHFIRDNVKNKHVELRFIEIDQTNSYILRIF